MEQNDDSALGRFLNEGEYAIEDDFLKYGYKIFEVANKEALDRIRSEIVKLAANFLQEKIPHDHHYFLSTIHSRVSDKQINALRLHVFEALNAQSWVRGAYFQCAKTLLDIIVGNELVMQRKVNLSIQMPNDKSSILPVHADTWSGDSPYEVVLWLPFVDVAKTQSMFILPMAQNQLHVAAMEKKGISKTQEIMDEIKEDVIWLELKYGQGIIFTQNVMHGNVLNEEKTTRWSCNCRFKSAFSPYSDKKIGEFFEPITLKPATRLGVHYELPDFSGSKE